MEQRQCTCFKRWPEEREQVGVQAVSLDIAWRSALGSIPTFDPGCPPVCKSCASSCPVGSCVGGRGAAVPLAGEQSCRESWFAASAARTEEERASAAMGRWARGTREVRPCPALARAPWTLLGLLHEAALGPTICALPKGTVQRVGHKWHPSLLCSLLPGCTKGPGCHRPGRKLHLAEGEGRQ